MAVDECPAGPAMDAAVAEAAGWGKNFIYDRDGLPERTAYVDPQDNYREVVADIAIWHPSINIAMAWKLLEGGEATIHVTNKSIICIIAPEYGYCMELLSAKAQAKGETAPLAICRAFLKANDVEHIEVPE